MSQRSFTNERYRKDAKIGSTRKSAAKAKPVRKQGSVSTTSAAKPKKAEQEKDWAGLPTTPKIKMWRRVWWVLLLSGLALIAATYLLPELKGNLPALKAISVVVLVLSGSAVLIDLLVIRRLRNELIASMKKPAKGEAAKGAAKGESPKSDAPKDKTPKNDGEAGS